MLRRQRGGGEPPSPEELRLAVDAQRCLQEVAMLLPPKVCSSKAGPSLSAWLKLRGLQVS
jgi:hypothetical protein